MKVVEYKTMLSEDFKSPYLSKVREIDVKENCLLDRSEELFEFTKNNLDIIHAGEENMYLVCVLSNQKPVGFFKVSQGSINGTVAGVREIFQKALLIGAVNIFLVHNHPSGSLNPSKEDIAVTKKMKEAGDLLGVNLLDHIIVSSEGYYSFRGAGIDW